MSERRTGNTSHITSYTGVVKQARKTLEYREKEKKGGTRYPCFSFFLSLPPQRVINCVLQGGDNMTHNYMTIP